MTLTKSLLLGSAATLVAVAGAQAAAVLEELALRHDRHRLRELVLAADRRAVWLIDVVVIAEVPVVLHRERQTVRGGVGVEPGGLNLVAVGALDRAGDRVWPLPLFDEYREQLKSEIADMINAASGRGAGAITAALEGRGRSTIVVP